METVEGLILFTVSHELVHFIKDGSPQDFNALAKFLTDNYVDRKKSIRDYKIDEMRRNPSLTPNQAYEEVIARLCESFLTDIHLSDKAAELYRTNKGLANRIRDFLTDMREKINAFLKGVEPESNLGKIGREIAREYNQAYDLFIQGIQNASENMRNATNTKKATDNSGTKLMSREVDDNGNPYWQIEAKRDIFKGIKSIAKLKKAAYNFILNGDKGTRVESIIDGNPLEFIRVSAREYVYGRASQKLTENEYKQKMRMSTSVLDLIDNANITYDAPDFKNHKLFPNGFKNYQGRVGIDDTIFAYIVRVGKSNTGTIFYDINLEADGKVPHAKRASLIKTSASDNSIRDKSKKSNTPDGKFLV